MQLLMLHAFPHLSEHQTSYQAFCRYDNCTWHMVNVTERGSHWCRYRWWYGSWPQHEGGRPATRAHGDGHIRRGVYWRWEPGLKVEQVRSVFFRSRGHGVIEGGSWYDQLFADSEVMRLLKVGAGIFSCLQIQRSWGYWRWELVWSAVCKFRGHGLGLWPSDRGWLGHENDFYRCLWSLPLNQVGALLVTGMSYQ